MVLLLYNNTPATYLLVCLFVSLLMVKQTGGGAEGGGFFFFFHLGLFGVDRLRGGLMDRVISPQHNIGYKMFTPPCCCCYCGCILSFLFSFLFSAPKYDGRMGRSELIEIFCPL